MNSESVGNRQAQAVVRVVAVDDHGQIHSSFLPSPVDKNRHLLARTVGGGFYSFFYSATR